MSKQRELNDLRDQEVSLETSVTSTKNQLETISNTQQETQLHLSQVKILFIVIFL